MPSQRRGRTTPELPPEPRSAERSDKLYVVTRQDLSSGYQTTQALHAAADLILAQPSLMGQWHSRSNSVIVLAAPDEKALTRLLEEATRRKITTQAFREPDLGDELTAIAFTPGKETVRLLSNLPLAGRRQQDQAHLQAREARLREVSWAMMETAQTKGQDVLQHGRSVREHYRALTQHLRGEINLTEYDNWRLPSWIGTYRDDLVRDLPDTWVMDRYLTMHDCGKPSVLQVDEEGRNHYPGHAEASTRVYRETYGETADETVAWYIQHDMDIHLAKAADLPALAEDRRVIGSLLAAVAEVTSNAAMFGGIESTGYKMKAKHLESRGKALCKLLYGEKKAS